MINNSNIFLIVFILLIIYFTINVYSDVANNITLNKKSTIFQINNILRKYKLRKKIKNT